jgi:hypothetical protein
MIAARAAEAERLGLSIPASFVKFMTDPELFGSVPSCTACYYDLGSRLLSVPAQAGPERLLRFMNDQQACCLWYLLLEPGGGHRVALAWPRWREGASGEALEDCANPEDVCVCAPSFEEFIKRFWIENTIWFSRDAALEGELGEYAVAARKAIAAGLVDPGR